MGDTRYLNERGFIGRAVQNVVKHKVATVIVGTVLLWLGARTGLDLSGYEADLIAWIERAPEGERDMMEFFAATAWTILGPVIGAAALGVLGVGIKAGLAYAKRLGVELGAERSRQITEALERFAMANLSRWGLKPGDSITAAQREELADGGQRYIQLNKKDAAVGLGAPEGIMPRATIEARLGPVLSGLPQTVSAPAVSVTTPMQP